MNYFATAFSDEEEVPMTPLEKPAPFEPWTFNLQLNAALNSGASIVEMWHPEFLCTGNGCLQHPLLNDPASLALYRAIEVDGCSWGDIVYNDEMEALAAETEEQKAGRIQRQAERERQSAMEAEAAIQAAKLNHIRFTNQLRHKKGEKGVAKIQQPCKRIYFIPGKGAMMSAQPCNECFGHEFTDAKGGFNAPHECAYLHPGEAGWLPEWNSLPVTRDKWRAPKPLPQTMSNRTGPVVAKATTVYLSNAPKPVRRAYVDNSAW